jgi:hypothetical protein
VKSTALIESICDSLFLIKLSTSVLSNYICIIKIASSLTIRTQRAGKRVGRHSAPRV